MELQRHSWSLQKRRDCLLSNRKLEISILNLSDVYKLDVTKRIDSEYFQKKYLEMDDGIYSIT